MQNILDKYKIKIDLNTILSIWNEGDRHYHNLNHLNKLLEDINNSNLSEIETDILIIVALFHDIVYDVKNRNNEEKSSEFFLNCCGDKSNPYIKIISQIILDTKTHSISDEFLNKDISDKNLSNKNFKDLYSKMSKLFCGLDMSICESSYDELLEWEEGIYDEYKVFGNQIYKEHRLKFLESLLDKYVDNTDNLLKLIDYVKSNYISEMDSKYHVGDIVVIKQDLSDLIGKIGYKNNMPKHPLYKFQSDNENMLEFLGQKAKITYVVNADDPSNDRRNLRFSRYLIDIDNGDYWWVDECFE